MTNTTAIIALVVTTNWITTSITRPVCNQPGCLVIHYATEHQIGAIVTNTVAIIVWKDKTHQVTLESTQPFWEGTIMREKSSSGFNTFTNLIFNLIFK